MKLPAAVKIVEVGPRDGLQNEKGAVPTEAKVAFIEKLAEAGSRFIEAASFVNPKWVPRMADSAEVYRAIAKREDVVYSALIPNEQGLEAALAVGAREVAIFTAASDSFNLKNTNCTVEESFRRFAPVVRKALEANVPVRGYVSTCFGCPYEGEVPPARAADVAARLLEIGCYEVSVGDTIGVATPAAVERVLERLLAGIPPERLALHLHDTRGTALANVLTGLQMGIATYDASAGGLGGCPYAPGASGNVATEDLLYMLHGMGIETGIDLEKQRAAAAYMAGVLGRTLPSRYLAAGPWAPKGRAG